MREELKAVERSHRWGSENKISGVRDERDPMCSLQLRASTYSLHELIGFTLVADSSPRQPEGFDSEVGWEGTSGVVVIFRHSFHPSFSDVHIGSKPVPLILSHSS